MHAHLAVSEPVLLLDGRDDLQRDGALGLGLDHKQRRGRGELQIKDQHRIKDEPVSEVD